MDEHLEKLRLTAPARRLAGDLAYSEQRTLEIGMALATDPEILLLDEPTGWHVARRDRLTSSS